MPVHGEGSSVWKELEAVKDLLLKSKKYGYIFEEQLQSGPRPTEPPRKDITFMVQFSTGNKIASHTHEITVTADQVSDVLNQLKNIQITCCLLRNYN
jgi:hypothetical protein